MSRALVPVLAAVAVAALLLAVVGWAHGRSPADPPPGAAIGPADREAVGLVPVRRGASAAADPAVDLTDPAAVARAYLAAAYSVTASDAGATHLRATGYALPGSPPAAVGLLVLDPPPPGAVRTATVTALDLVATDHDGGRRGYRAELGTATGPPGGPSSIELVTRDVVLVRVHGRWLVAADTAPGPDLAGGERG